jgi:flagellar basal body-associated protein FliL
MEYTEEKPKKSLTLYIIITILVIAIIAIYFIFFSQPGGLGKLFGSGITDSSLVPDSLKKDFTGGIVNLKFNPTTILDNVSYKSLKAYAEPVEIRVTPGRPNPFLPF